MGSADNGKVDENKIYGYVDLFKSTDDTEPFRIYQLSGKKILIGRGRKCDICIRDRRFSKMQCRIKISGTEENYEASFTNLGSKAITVFKNLSILQNQAVCLKCGDRFRLYDTEFRFRSYNYSPNASNCLPGASGTRRPPIIRLVGKEQQDTHYKSNIVNFYKKFHGSEKTRPSPTSVRVRNRINKISNGEAEKQRRTKRASSLRRFVVQKLLHKSVQENNSPLLVVDENLEEADLVLLHPTSRSRRTVSPKVSSSKLQSFNSPASKYVKDATGSAIQTIQTDIASASTSYPKEALVSPISKPIVDAVQLPPPSPGASASIVASRALKYSTIQIKDYYVAIQRVAIIVDDDSKLETTPKSQLQNKSLNSSRSSLKSASKLDSGKEKGKESPEKTPTTTKSKLKKTKRTFSEVEIMDLQEPEGDARATNEVNTITFEVPKIFPTIMTASKVVIGDSFSKKHQLQERALPGNRTVYLDPPSEKYAPARKNKSQSQSEKSASEADKEERKLLAYGYKKGDEQPKKDIEAESDKEFVSRRSPQ